MTEKIFVTGASGNVGREVVKNLQQMGQTVLAAALNEEDAGSIPANEQTEIAYFDFARKENFPALLSGVSKLFLLRPPQIADVETYLFPLIDAARQAEIEKIVFLSLMGIESSRWAPHYAVEKYLQASGVPYVFLRPSFYMQNLSGTHAQDIRVLNEIILPAGRGKTSFIDVRDIGAVAAKTLVDSGHEGSAYTLTGSEALDYFQVAEIFSKELGRSIKYKKPSALRFHRHMRRVHNMAPKFIWVMQLLYLTVRLGKGSQVTGTVNQLLGRPPITVQQFVQDYKRVWQPEEAAGS